jgi:hypothetical protein
LAHPTARAGLLQDGVAPHLHLHLPTSSPPSFASVPCPTAAAGLLQAPAACPTATRLKLASRYVAANGLQDWKVMPLAATLTINNTTKVLIKVRGTCVRACV